jgi:hypothetical protein
MALEKLPMASIIKNGQANRAKPASRMLREYSGPGQAGDTAHRQVSRYLLFYFHDINGESVLILREYLGNVYSSGLQEWAIFSVVRRGLA